MRDRVGVVVLAALAPAATLAFDPDGLFPFGPVKWLAVSTLVPLGAALLLLARPARAVPRPTIALAALLAVLAVAAVGGADPWYAWTGTPERHLGVAAWLLVLIAFVAGQSLEPGRDGSPIAGGLLVAALGVGGLATLEALDVGPDVLDAGGRLGAPFGSPAYLGAATCLLLPPLVVRARHGSQHRAAAALAAGLLGVAALGSGARAAWVGLAVAGLAVAVARRRSGGSERRAWRLAVVGAAVAVLAVVTPAGGRIADAFDADAAGGTGRLDEWRVASRVLLDHPVLGVGPEGYRVAFAEGVDDAYEREHGREPLPDRAHSAPLDIALAGGFPALVAWLAVLALVGGHVRRALRDDRSWLRGMAAGLAAYAVGALLLFPLAELEPVAALLAGIVVGATTDAGRPRALPRVAALPLLGLAGVALVAGGLDVAADRTAAAATEAARDGRTGDALHDAERAAALRPDEVRLHLLVADAALADERGFVVALTAVDDALDLSPGDPIARRRRAELLVGRARATLVPAHVDAANEELDRLLADDPRHGALHLLAALAAELAGDDAGASEHLARAESLGVDVDGHEESGT